MNLAFSGRPAHRRSPLITLTAALVVAGSLAACGSSSESSDSADSTAGSSAASPAGAATGTAAAGGQASGLPAVAGYQVGEIPPIPLFSMPDLSVLGAEPASYAPDLAATVSSQPGITVGPARCDASGALDSSHGRTLLDGSAGGTTMGDGATVTTDGDGSGTYSDGDTTVTTGGDGSGTYSDGKVTITSDGSGSGTYSAGEITVTTDSDGSGTYSDGKVTITSDGNGSGTYSNSGTSETITVSADGSGTYSTDQVTNTNAGDGSGTYSDGTGLLIINNGNGTGTVNGQAVDMEPLPPVGKVGDFPPMSSIKPITSCGTVITLDDGVLFDFGSAEVRPEATTTLTSLSGVLTKAGAPTIHVYGHTDSVSDEAFNQTLSEQRAQAVVDILKGAGATSSIDATGYGETRPVAPNENADGSDSPAGRQLNRRVEIFVPAF